MDNHRRFPTIAILLLLSGITLNVILTRLGYFDGATGSILSVPIWSEEGYFATGLILLAVMAAGLLLLLFSLKQGKSGVFIISLAATVILPPLILHTI